MVLFDDVVVILDLVHGDRYGFATVDLINRCLVGAAFIYRDFGRCAILMHGFFGEPPPGRDVAEQWLNLTGHRTPD